MSEQKLLQKFTVARRVWDTACLVTQLNLFVEKFGFDQQST
jgi:hypothetical protein